MIDFDDARDLLAREAAPLTPRRLRLLDALGRRLAAVPRSALDLPPGDVSAMDGYAVRASDLIPGRPLPVVAEVAAGATPAPLPPTAAARIFTGALLPAGADTVVPQEDADREAGGRVVLRPFPPGTDVRRRAEVVAAGSELGQVGDRVTPQLVGLLAACGVAEIEATPRPTIAVVVTGAELVGEDATPAPGEIRDSNGPQLAALCAAAGLGLALCERAPDDRDQLRAALTRALEAADLVVTSGGVSVGDYDLVPEVVAGLGGKVLFHRVRIKPGKPVLAARIGDRWLVGLPGNPLAVLAGWRVFVWPLAEALAGDPRALIERPHEATLSGSPVGAGGRLELRPATLGIGTDGLEVEVVRWHGSHDLRAAGTANALARLEPGQELEPGERLPCYPLDRISGATR